MIYSRHITSAATTLNKKNVISFLLFSAAGILGNIYGFQIFFNVDFLFGSIFSMLALQMLGVGWAMATTIIAGSCTLFLWNHPYAMVIFAVETLSTAILWRFFRVSFVLANTLAWLLMGMPLIWLFYYGIMDVSVGDAVVIMLDQSLNGICNALLARIIYLAVSMRMKIPRQAPLREVVFTLLSAFVIFPVLFIVSLEAWNHYRQIETTIRNRLGAISSLAGSMLKYWTDDHLGMVASLAARAAQSSAGEMQEYLEIGKSADPHLLSLLLIDRNARSIAVTPIVDESGRQGMDRDFSDRPYLTGMMHALKPVFSDVIVSKIGTPAPMVAALAPVVKNGLYDGYVAGILDLRGISSFLQKVVADGETIHFTLLDGNDRVIVTSRGDLKVMGPLWRDRGELLRLDKNFFQWVPSLPDTAPLMERWEKSLYIMDMEISGATPWRLIMEMPTKPFHNGLNSHYTRYLLITFTVILMVIFCAEVLSRKLVSSIEKLSHVSTGLPQTVSGEKPLSWPWSGIIEIDRLIENFKVMADALAERFKEVNNARDELEMRVYERTMELAAKQGQLETLNETLEQMVQEEVSKNREKDQIMMSQSRQAAMGEMISNIAHQWRQPLNNLGLIIQNVQYDYESGRLTPQQMSADTEMGMKLICFMSQTIDDFRNFFRHDKEPKCFSINDAARKAIGFVEASLKDHGIVVAVEGDDLEVNGYPNEFAQVLLNLLTNAKDALIERAIDHPMISLTISRNARQAVVAIGDNAGGISERIIGHIFDPYFTTKEQNKGTGIGLYMSKTIIEKHMGGSLTVANREKGAEFRIEIGMLDDREAS